MNAVDRLPIEVLHLICRSLPRSDAATARLIDRRFAQVAAFYLVDTVQLHTSVDSFVRLQNLADHPIFSQTIKHIVYNQCTISGIQCRQSYFAHFEKEWHEDGPQLPTSPWSSTDRAERLYQRNKKKFDNEVSQNYATYLKLFQAQQKLLTGHAMDIYVGQQIPKLVRLQSVRYLPRSKCHYLPSDRFVKEFGIDCAVPMRSDASYSDIQLRSLLLPAGGISSSLRKIVLEAVSPKFFSHRKRYRAAMVNAFRLLTHVDIKLKLAPGDLGCDLDAGVAFERYLSSGLLKDSLSAAENLVSLSFGIYSSQNCQVDIAQNVVAGCIWPQMTTLELGAVTMDMAGFLKFLNDQPKLTELHLLCMELTNGCWIKALDQMRSDLKLRQFNTIGHLRDSHDIWILDRLHVDKYCEGMRWPLSNAIDLYTTEPQMGWAEDADQDESNPLTLYNSYEDPLTLYDQVGPAADMYDDEELDDLSDHHGLDPAHLPGHYFDYHNHDMDSLLDDTMFDEVDDANFWSGE